MRNWGEATKIDRRRRGFFFSAPCFFYSPTSHKNWETERRMIGDGEVSKKKKVGLCPTKHTHTHKGRETNTYTHTYRDKCFSVTPLQQDSACGWVRVGVFLFLSKIYHTRRCFSITARTTGRYKPAKLSPTQNILKSQCPGTCILLLTSILLLTCVAADTHL